MIITRLLEQDYTIQDMILVQGMKVIDYNGNAKRQHSNK